MASTFLVWLYRLHILPHPGLSQVPKADGLGLKLVDRPLSGIAIFDWRPSETPPARAMNLHGAGFGIPGDDRSLAARGTLRGLLLHRSNVSPDTPCGKVVLEPALVSNVLTGAMHSQAYLIIKAAAASKDDVSRLREAFDLVWAKIADRVGDHAAAREEVADRLARLIVGAGNRRPTDNAATLAKIVGRTFDAPVDQD